MKRFVMRNSETGTWSCKSGMTSRLRIRRISSPGQCRLVCSRPNRPRAVRLSRESLSKLPRLIGPAIRLAFLPKLTASRRRLYSNESRGEAVHAATFVRDRLITMEAELIRQPAEFRRILVHELFHFVWVRLGNTRRQSWQLLIEAELNAGARGELGWSAER